MAGAYRCHAFWYGADDAIHGQDPRGTGSDEADVPYPVPRLLPLMMPKVMPVMLERVAEQVPMPDYMEEQMGELMPKVMDHLMPHMIGDVVPLVTQPMIDYIFSLSSVSSGSRG